MDGLAAELEAQQREAEKRRRRQNWLGDAEEAVRGPVLAARHLLRPALVNAARWWLQCVCVCVLGVGGGRSLNATASGWCAGAAVLLHGGGIGARRVPRRDRNRLPGESTLEARGYSMTIATRKRGVCGRVALCGDPLGRPLLGHLLCLH